jgi:hypothetical protein
VVVVVALLVEIVVVVFLVLLVVVLVVVLTLKVEVFEVVNLDEVERPLAVDVRRCNVVVDPRALVVGLDVVVVSRAPVVGLVLLPSVLRT